MRPRVRWKRVSCRYRWLTTPPRKVRAAGAPVEVCNDVARIAVERLGSDRVCVERFSTAGDHGFAAARGAKGQTFHAYAHRQESRRGREDTLDDAGSVHAADARTAGDARPSDGTRRALCDIPGGAERRSYRRC